MEPRSKDFQVSEIFLRMKLGQVAQVGFCSKRKLMVIHYMGVSKNGGKTPKMDGENKGKHY